MKLTDKYAPQAVKSFSGLARAKCALAHFVEKPEAGAAMLFVGPPGTGKTTMALALAGEIGAAVIHVPAQTCTVETVRQVWDEVHYFPGAAKRFFLVLVDEADQMSKPAQLALLSHLDGTANLTFGFGRASSAHSPLPVVWVFTANGTGYRGVTPPNGLEARFLSRVWTIEFPPLTRIETEMFVRDVWTREGQPFGTIDVSEIAADAQGSARNLLNALQLALMGYGDETPRANEKPDSDSRPLAASRPVKPTPKNFVTPAEMFQEMSRKFRETGVA